MGGFDRGAGFTGGINAIKYGSISCGGAEAWQIKMPCGLISTTQEGDVCVGIIAIKCDTFYIMNFENSLKITPKSIFSSNSHDEFC